MEFTSAHWQHQTFFLDLYPEAKRFKRMVYIGAFLLSAMLALLMHSYVKVPMWTDNVLSATILLSAFVLFFLLIAIATRSYRIIGKDRVLTVLDNKTFLKPGEKTRCWAFPRSVHTIPLDGTCDVEFDIEDLEQYHNLEDVLPEFKYDEPGIKSLHVLAMFKWSISRDADFRVQDKHVCMNFHDCLVEAMKWNSLPHALSEHIEKTTEKVVRRICAEHLTNRRNHGDFSDLVHRSVDRALEKEWLVQISKLINIHVTELHVELHTRTLTKATV